MKIGVLGGSFNPIHNGHIYLAEQAMEKLSLERMIVVPTYIPPHKSSKELANPQDRLAMCLLATKGNPRFQVSEYEIEEKGKSYTYKTLRHLQDKYPEAELYLIMGSDMFLTVQDWRMAQDLYKLATFCTARRETNDDLTALDMHKEFLEMQGARCELFQVEALPMSSTEVREKIRRKEPVKSLLHPDVLSYIRKMELYL